MLYILKQVCLLQKYGKNGYVIDIKTTVVCLLLKYKKRYVAHIKTSMFTTEIGKKWEGCKY